MKEQLVKTYDYQYSSKFSTSRYDQSKRYCSGLFMLSQKYVNRIKTKEGL